MTTICFLIGLLLFKEAVTTTVEDPCPDDLKESTKVADMCESSISWENSNVVGNENVDSVVLRARTLKDQCICRLSLINQTITENVIIIKYNRLQSSAPVISPCGLGLDMAVVYSGGTSKPMDALNCLLPPSKRISLNIGTYLRFTSIIYDGNFTHGYCVQIYREAFKALPILRLKCDSKLDTDRTVQTSTLWNIQTTNTSESSTLNMLNTTEVVQTKELGDYVDGGLSQIYYMGIGLASGVLLIIIIVAVIILVLRNRSRKIPTQTNSHINKEFENDDNSNTHYDDELKNNVLYVPADEISDRNGTHDTFKYHEAQYTTIKDTDMIPKPELKQQSIHKESYDVNTEEVGYLNTQSPQDLSPNSSEHVYSVVQKRDKIIP